MATRRADPRRMIAYAAVFDGVLVTLTAEFIKSTTQRRIWQPGLGSYRDPVLASSAEEIADPVKMAAKVGAAGPAFTEAPAQVAAEAKLLLADIRDL